MARKRYKPEEIVAKLRHEAVCRLGFHGQIPRKYRLHH
jgi:nitroimidazol reductase NimA-like FMN-containing flavoprotein (pyridoxamine 5'-phosphate oxidase superfamily)